MSKPTRKQQPQSFASLLEKTSYFSHPCEAPDCESVVTAGQRFCETHRCDWHNDDGLRCEELAVNGRRCTSHALVVVEQAEEAAVAPLPNEDLSVPLDNQPETAITTLLPVELPTSATAIREVSTPLPQPYINNDITDLGTFLEQVKTPSVYRSKGYASHMCSTGADDAIRYIERTLQDSCGLRKSLQDKYLWNMGLLLLRYGLSKLTPEELSSIASVASSNSEDLVVHKFFSILKERIDN